MLLIKSKGGLGNRLLSAATAIAYANATQRQWTVDWCDGLYSQPGVNAFNQLYQSANQNSHRTITQDSKVYPKLWHGRLDWPVRKQIIKYYSHHHSSPLIYRKLSAP